MTPLAATDNERRWRQGKATCDRGPASIVKPSTKLILQADETTIGRRRHMTETRGLQSFAVNKRRMRSFSHQDALTIVGGEHASAKRPTNGDEHAADGSDYFPRAPALLIGSPTSRGVRASRAVSPGLQSSDKWADRRPPSALHFGLQWLQPCKGPVEA